jgi:hypothetical protein
MAADNFCIYLQNRLIQTSQAGGQWFSDTHFSIPWIGYLFIYLLLVQFFTVVLSQEPLMLNGARIFNSKLGCLLAL